MKVDQRLYITLNLAAEPRSLAVLVATLHSILQQIEHPLEIEQELDDEISDLFIRLIDSLEEKEAAEGV
ncbi:MAG: hypothetical protein ACRC5A_10890, partial [Enterobacteriaceae bacterium]